MTSANLVRLWLVAGQGDGRTPASTRKDDPTAAARTEPTVSLPSYAAVEQNAASVYRYALRLTGHQQTAEDLAQETLLRGWRNRAKLRDPRVARVWLLRIATNLWTDQLRQKKFRPSVLVAEPPCPKPGGAETANHRENVERVIAAMDELPPRQRQVLHLVTCEQMSLSEVAAVLEIGPAAVKSNLAVARKAMRERLRDVYVEVCGRQACRDTT